MGHRLQVATLAAAALVPICASAATAVLAGPPPRAITDPKSVVSETNPDAAPLPVAELYDVRGGGGAVWSPDGKTIVFSTNLTGRYNLWKVASGSGFPQQLTQSDDRQAGMSVSPDGKMVLFESDYGGGAISDLFETPLAGGPVVNLTNTKDVSENAARFSPDGTHIVFDRRPATSPAVELAWMDLATRKVTMLTHDTAPGSFWTVAGFAEGAHVLIASCIDVSQTQSTVWRIDTADGKAQALTDTASKAYNEASAVSADGRTIALKTQTPDGTMQAALFDTAMRTTTLVKPDGWEQGSGSLSPDAGTMIVSSNVDGRTDLFDVNGGRVTRLDLPPGSNEEADGPRSLSPDGKHLLVAHEASNTPFDLWTVDLAANRATQLTTLGLAAVSPANLPSAQIVHYKSGRRHGDQRARLGAVQSQTRRQRAGRRLRPWRPGRAVSGLFQPARGCARLARLRRDRAEPARVDRLRPRLRGGQLPGLGGGDLTDEIYGAKFLEATGYVDAKKIGMTGGSYGGYMTLMALGKTPDLWAAGVEMYGIIDWFSMYENGSPPLRQYQVDLLGDPVKDKAVYEAASPMTYIAKVKAPLLVLQGENDITVPKEQADKVVAMLKAKGRTVDAHYYAGEGHGFSKRENQIDLDRAAGGVVRQVF